MLSVGQEDSKLCGRHQKPVPGYMCTYTARCRGGQAFQSWQNTSHQWSLTRNLLSTEDIVTGNLSRGWLSCVGFAGEVSKTSNTTLFITRSPMTSQQASAVHCAVAPLVYKLQRYNRGTCPDLRSLICSLCWSFSWITLKIFLSRSLYTFCQFLPLPCSDTLHRWSVMGALFPAPHQAYFSPLCLAAPLGGQVI